MSSRLLAALFCSFLVLGASSSAQASSDATRPSERRGWSVRSTTDDDEANRTQVDSAAFVLETDTLLHPAHRTAESRRWSGALRIAETGSYRFGVLAEGTEASFRVQSDSGGASVASPGAPDVRWSEPLELARGAELRLTVDVPGGLGARRLQVWWECAWTESGGFPPELLSSRDVRVPANELAAVESTDRIREGLRLVDEKRCLHCHTETFPGVERPERDAPSLFGLRSRMGAEWLRRWLADPQAMRHGTAMPRVPITRDEFLRDTLVHYLMSFGEPSGFEVATEERTLAQGRTLYHGVGCIACHGALEPLSVVFDDPTLDDTVPTTDVPRPFGDMLGKWDPGALSAFLLDPDATHPSGRMPRMRLSNEEADLITSYLVSQWSPAEYFEPHPDMAMEGERVFQIGLCSTCHGNDELDARVPPLTVRAPKDITRMEGGCMDSQHDFAPFFQLHGDEASLMHAGLRAASGIGKGPLARPWIAEAPTPLVDHRERVAELNCAACHRIEGDGGVAPELDLYFQPADERVDLGDEGRLPPELLQPGFKYTTEWLRAILLEEGVERPYMNVRMPVFRADLVEPLVHGFAHLDGVRPNTDAPPPTASDEYALAGRDLMARGTFGCIACHVFGDRPANGSPGPALDHFAARLRWEWGKPYLANPQRFRPGGRMPDFGEGRVSSVRTVLDGRLDAQIDAMWSYFRLGADMPVPAGLVADGGLKLDPSERPIVLRGFVRDAGARGIAIGLPVGVHFAYDAEHARLAYAWRGDFLDASGAWAGRGGQQYGGQGERVWSAAEGALIESDSVDYHGYSLDAEGRPTFHARFGSVEVDEAFGARVAPELVLTRSLTLRSPKPGAEIWVRAGPNARIALAVGFRPELVERDGVLWVHVQLPENSSQASFVLEVRP